MKLRRLNSNFTNKRLLVLLVVFVIVFMVFWSLKNDTKNCFLDDEWTDGKTLQDISDNTRLASSSKNVFFHETSCSVDGVIKLTSRQACAIESAGRFL